MKNGAPAIWGELIASNPKWSSWLRSKIVIKLTKTTSFFYSLKSKQAELDLSLVCLPIIIILSIIINFMNLSISKITEISSV
jgi:hypothetical protein